jgi:nitrite reductase/ring-hydroxylating ferredoxin subunit
MDGPGTAPPGAWYVACFSPQLRQKPLARTVAGTPLALFRDGGGRPVALLDRCPHRNVPLSCGAVREGLLECCYHGWRFDGSGSCRAIPGLVDVAGVDRRARRASPYPTVEQDGLVWVQPFPGPGQPYRPPHLGDPAYSTVRRHVRFPAGLHACLENALDVPHTAYLHRGLFRGQARHTITAVRRPIDGGVEVQYLGEPVGMGPLRLPKGSARTFDHWDRFLLPSIAQIEYAVEGRFRIVNTIVQLPLGPFRTRAWFVVRFSSPLPAPLVRAVVHAQGRRILGQDADALARQTERTRAFGGERYASTELDLLGTAIWRLLRSAERAEQPDGTDLPLAPVSERQVVFDA